MILYGFNFVFDATKRAAMSDFVMPADELVAELRAGANLARPELRSSMFGVLKASLIGAGMGQIDAQATAFRLMHDGVNSSAHSREIVLALLDGE